jgi:hypothetical protein
MMIEQNNLNNHLQYGEAWSQALSVDHYRTAIIAEFGEFLNQETSPAYKWWEDKDPALYSEWMSQLEIIDILHFYLSIAIIGVRDMRDKVADFSSVRTDQEFQLYKDLYVGVDLGHRSGWGVVGHPNIVNHRTFMSLVRAIVFEPWDVYDWVLPLASLAGSMGMSCEKFSALYYGKVILNSVRWKNLDWTKIDVVGVEDNERLFPLVQVYLDDPTLSLKTDFKQMVEDEFYTQV